MTEMDGSGCTHFVAVNLFSPEAEVGRAVRSLPAATPTDVARRVEARARAGLADRLRESNRWLCDLASARPAMSAFVAADPGTLGATAGAAHLLETAEWGARGVKLHPVVQRFAPSDPRMAAIYRVCEELGLAVLSHAGRAKGTVQQAEPMAYAPVLEAFPRLHLVLAHLGGASWRQAAALAARFPNVSFDLCEIVAWLGAPAAPSADELGRMIVEIGPERVFFGTDFPWYRVERTIEQVLDLPHLSLEERQGILGTNAVRRMNLPVAI
jgi:predicted TIM-barrel fold metal-dependent hydrolase